jgi:parallel beta-helix repeat protein
VATGGGYWLSGSTRPGFSQSAVQCLPNTSRCLRPEQVFFDGKPLEQVASNPGTGQFAVNSNRKVILKDDPKGHTVEVSVRRHWVLGSTTADNVTVEGFTMKHAANEGRNGALMNRSTQLNPGEDSWTVQKNVLSDAHRAVLSLKHGLGHKILNNDISRGGQISINGAGDGEIIKGNKIHHNNTEDFNFRWEAGGAKFAPNVKNTVFDANEVYNNKGNGVHYDIDADNTISNNRVHHNIRKGIQYEKSTRGKIFSNVLWENGWATLGKNADTAGIMLHNVTTTEVYNNTLAWNADGIAVFALDRDGTTHDLVHDVYVHDNTVLGKNDAVSEKNHVALGWFQNWATTLFDPANNRGANNKYWYTTPEGSLERFRWRLPPILRKLKDFNRTLGEENGRYLTISEKDAVVTNKGIPLAPESH